VGEKFNPEFHEAVESVESGKESGIIVEEIQKGYLLNSEVLRPSKVKIAK
jgi:molecular chaperone GrpE